jgi:gamma-glutamyl:cysteine ligase YbdK (ATP-grasp superfamily)
MRHTFESFMSQFSFDSSKAGLVGIERESLIRNPATGAVVPTSPLIVKMIHDEHPHLTERIGYELSACQIEERTSPIHFTEVSAHLDETEQVVRETLARFGLEPQYEGIGPADMPLDVYPDERYQQIARTRPRPLLVAACRIIGVHVHIGMRDAERALAAYNFARENLHSIRAAADTTGGERMALYRMMVPDPEPVPFKDWHEHYRHAIRCGYADNPRNNWMLVRISRYGTLEFRLGDGMSTRAIDSLARECRALCRIFF